jgi:hypothetical protein
MAEPESSKSKNRIGMITMLLPTLLSSIALLACTGRDLALPTDRELVALFRTHRESFERLRTMALQDTRSVSYLSTDTLDHNFLSAARRKEYADLLSAIRSDLVMRIDPLDISFSYWGGGEGLSVNRSWMKGISYLPHGPKDVGVIVQSLDSPPRQDGQFYVPIEGNWYIVYKQLE